MIGTVLFVIWFGWFVTSTIWVNTRVVEQDKNFGLVFLYAFANIGLGYVIFELIQVLFLR